MGVISTKKNHSDCFILKVSALAGQREEEVMLSSSMAVWATPSLKSPEFSWVTPSPPKSL